MRALWRSEYSTLISLSLSFHPVGLYTRWCKRQPTRPLHSSPVRASPLALSPCARARAEALQPGARTTPRPTCGKSLRILRLSLPEGAAPPSPCPRPPHRSFDGSARVGLAGASREPRGPELNPKPAALALALCATPLMLTSESGRWRALAGEPLASAAAQPKPGGPLPLSAPAPPDAAPPDAAPPDIPVPVTPTLLMASNASQTLTT